MQRFSHPQMFLCPLYNMPEMANTRSQMYDQEEEQNASVVSSSSAPSRQRFHAAAIKLMIYRDISRRAKMSLKDFTLETQARRAAHAAKIAETKALLEQRRKEKWLRQSIEREQEQQEQEAQMFRELIREEAFDA